MKGSRCSLLSLVVALVAPATARPVSLLRPTLSGRGSYGESHTFVADLDDGTYVHLSLAITNLGPGGAKGVCQGRVVPQRGEPWRAWTRVDRSGCSWKGGDGERLAIGPCTAWIDGESTGIEVALENASVRLVYAARPHGRAARDTVVVQGGDLYRSEVVLSGTPVAATLALPGEPARRVAGAGYLDHTRSTIPTRELARRWVRFRALRGSRPLLLTGREAPDGRMGPIWTCRGPGECQDGVDFKVERTGGGGVPAFRVEVRGGRGLIRLASGRLLYREAPVEDLGLLGKVVAPFVGSPVTYVYRAQATGEDGPIDGVLEIELAEE